MVWKFWNYFTIWSIYAYGNDQNESESLSGSLPGTFPTSSDEKDFDGNMDSNRDSTNDDGSGRGLLSLTGQLRGVDTREIVHPLESGGLGPDLRTLSADLRHDYNSVDHTPAPIPGAVDVTGHLTQIEKNAVAGGGFSDIYKAILKKGEGQAKTVALKVLRAVMIGDNDSIRNRILRLNREILVWEKLKHPNIVPLLGFAMKDQSPCLVAPWYHCNIHQYICKHPNADRPRLILDVINGLQYLHSHDPPIIHGDLKAANVLIDDTGAARICDFGSSRIMQECSTGLTTSTASGSIRWMAPELFSDSFDSTSQRTSMSDIYAFTLTALEIYSGEKKPFPLLKTDYAFIWEIGRDFRPSRSHYPCLNLEEHTWQIFERGWSVRAEDRPSAGEMNRLLKAKFKWHNQAKQEVSGLRRARKRALIIGIEYHNNSGFDSLPGPRNDITLMLEMLTKAGFRADDIVILSDTSSINAKYPNRQNIMRELRNLSSGLRDGDFGFVSFSGHGRQMKTGLDSLPDDPIAALVPVDGNPRDPGTWISSQELNDYLVQDLAAGASILVLCDSCHSGSILDLPFKYALQPEYSRNLWDTSCDFCFDFLAPSREKMDDEWLEANILEVPIGFVLCLSAMDSALEVKNHTNGKTYGALTYLFRQSFDRTVAKTGSYAFPKLLGLASDLSLMYGKLWPRSMIHITSSSPVPVSALFEVSGGHGS
ncbi:hypothetical protein FRC03_001925 [Tulasnella sp. 419]|nr:hypothetical protein FRC03_001925 [Tulasnella sp. 419]